MKTILLLIDTIYTLRGGAERQILEFCKNIEKSKYRIIVGCLSDKDALLDTVGHHVAKTVSFGVRRIYSLFGVLQGLKFKRFLHQEKVDILVTYHFGSDIWGTIFGRLAHIPVIISNRRDAGFWRKRYHAWAYKAVNRWVTKIIAVSDAVKEVVMNQEHVARDKLEVIHNGIDERRFAIQTDTNAIKQALGLASSSKVVGCVGNIRPIKGHIYLVEAARDILKALNDTHFLFIGEDLSGESLHLRVNSFPLSKNIHFLGKRDDIPELLGIMDVCVLPSLSEGLSNTLLEYLAAGKPVVATDAGGNAEVIQNNVNGLLVKKADAKDLATKVLSLLQDSKKAQQLGVHAKECTRAHFSIGRMVKHYQTLFDGLMEEKNEYTLRKKVKFFAKAVLSACVYYSGVFAIIRFLKRNKPTVICYHRVVEDFCKEKQHSLPGILVSKDSFIKQIQFFKRYYRVISMEDFIESIEGKRKLPRYSLLVTFDDGYQDNYTIAYPLLRQFGFAATIFLATDFIDSGMSPEWEQESQNRKMLSWQEVTQMSKDSVYFGAHTQSHLLCPASHNERFRREIEESKKVIETRVNRKVEAFAWPKGAYIPEAIDYVKSAGYKCGFSLAQHRKPAPNFPLRQFAVERICVNEGMYRNQLSNFSMPIFACALLGFWRRK
ncbi:MAG: glycosyltransferase [Candidatus Omnitrophota bacterium]|nr:MAG: glycosyltransferase [Candidatus Omnitrophota bacterium]